jgi:hypothetical protein
MQKECVITVIINTGEQKDHLNAHMKYCMLLVYVIIAI